MPNPLELFYWHRPEGGYEWQDYRAVGAQLSGEDSDETRFLVPKPMTPPRHWRYNPLISNPTLYREFAALEPTEEAFAYFASSYGDLGVGVFVVPDGGTGDNLMRYDPFNRWMTAHSAMSPVVDVLNAIQDHNAAALRKWFTIGHFGAMYERKDERRHEQSWVSIPNQHQEYLWRWAMEARSDDEALIRIAQGWAQDKINDAMGDNKKGTLTSVRILLEHERGRMGLHVTPHSLVGALWLQCARVLTLNPTFKSCEHCGKWFEMSADTRRKQSKYCSNRCKVAAYRVRRARPSAS